MKTLQEKFNAVNENRYTKAEFLRDAQKQYPQAVNHGVNEIGQILDHYFIKNKNNHEKG